MLAFLINKKRKRHHKSSNQYCVSCFNMGGSNAGMSSGIVIAKLKIREKRGVGQHPEWMS
jgi:anti-sigma-K factor RskA